MSNKLILEDKIRRLETRMADVERTYAKNNHEHTMYFPYSVSNVRDVVLQILKHLGMTVTRQDDITLTPIEEEKE